MNLLKFVIVVLSCICVVDYKLQPALGWKPTTHVYLAERALEDALDNGKITINRVNSETGEIVGNIGEYPVAPDILEAIRAFPDQYRAGVLGPDAYPDILTGQQVIHPSTNPGGSNHWLQHLWSQSDESPAIKAFVVGYLTHAAGDMYAHTFINNFTGGAFTLEPPNNAIKHILLEGYFDQHSPSPTFSASIAGVDDFIYRHMVDARPGTYLDTELLLQGGEGTSFSIPRIYSTLRAELEQDIPRLFQAADKCNWYDLTCSAILLRAEARYKEAWRDDIDRGLRAWPGVSDRIAKVLFFNPEKKANVEEAEAILLDYVNQHLISMSGSPDVVGDLAVLSNKILDVISQITPDFLLEPIRQLKDNIYDAIVVRATGMTRQQLKAYLENPGTYFDQVMTQGAGELIDRQTFNAKYLRLNNSTDKFDYRKVAAAYNTVAISKLLLLSQNTINQLLSDLGDSARLNQPNIMLGFIRTLDGDNEQQGMILAQNCATYRQMFMKQSGERLCIPLRLDGNFKGSGRSTATLYDAGNARVIIEVDDETWFDSGYGNFIYDKTRGRCLVGNFSGSGRSDIACLYDYGNFDVGAVVFASTGSSFEQSLWWISGAGNFNPGAVKGCVVGNFSGSGRSDIACLYDYGNFDVGAVVFVSNGSGFEVSLWWRSGAGNFNPDAVEGSLEVIPGDSGRSNIRFSYRYPENVGSVTLVSDGSKFDTKVER